MKTTQPMDATSSANRAQARTRRRARAIEQGRHSVTNRRARASERQESRNKRSAKQQMNLLDKRLGKGVGAKNERARLQKVLDFRQKKA